MGINLYYLAFNDIQYPLSTTLIAFFNTFLFFQVQAYAQRDSEIRNALKTILTPQGYPSIQIQALRRDIARRLMQAIEKQEEEDELQEFKNTLSRLRNSPDKKNLEALARGGYIRTLPIDKVDAEGLKRSDGDDAEVTTYKYEEKRGIQSLARNGDLNHRQRDVRAILDDWYDKRNIESLARDGVWVNGKRNIGSVKAQYKPTRNKRQVDYYDFDGDEYPSIYQNQNVYDYEELLKEINYPSTDKRFLGEYF